MADTYDPPETVLLTDYRPYPFEVDETRLAFDIRDGETTVRSELAVRRSATDAPLVLSGGADVELVSLAVDGQELRGNEYVIEGETLTIFDVPDACRVQVVTKIAPEKNEALDGLYKSRSMYCTQCEPEGFRNITYYPDRPDVLSRFTTSVTADAARFPVLLSNGNATADDIHDGRRTVTWRDPFPKPSYLFALVAGDLAVLEDEFVTCSGRRVTLRIYSEPHNIRQCGYAMNALKRAMRWDEERFGREYDLDIYMIVAVEDFNFGAMENKGLNIFNTARLLATADTATDVAHRDVEKVVAHEYFHNWSGNRVTCRNWFQLSLKEGFTVFRDAEFSSDMSSRTVKRIEDVEFLRSVQFVEDAGPLAHPVRPDSYVEISNFYTRTVYEKGAEVVRMIDTILGQARFRAGTDLYFERHDGSAVTTDDFLAAMEDASGISLSQFRRWYEQAGTPLLTVAEVRNGDTLRLAITQSCGPSPRQPRKQPFHIPLAFGVVSADGRDLLGATGEANGFAVGLETTAKVENPNGDGTLVAQLTEQQTGIELVGVPADAEVSFLRDFSAPVRVNYPRSPAALKRLAAADTNGFARWDAGQTLITQHVAARLGGSSELAEQVVALFTELGEAALRAGEDGEAKALFAAMLTLPRETYLLDFAPHADILAIADVRDELADRIAAGFDWLALAEANKIAGPYRPDAADIAKRALKHRALWYALRHLDRHDPPAAAALLDQAAQDADNLTDRLGAFAGQLALRSLPVAEKAAIVDAFYRRWSTEARVVDTWFSAQARNPLPGGLERVRALQAHDAFDIRNPNKARSLLLAFTDNVCNFHAADGTAYDWLVGHVLTVDAFNPKVASTLAKPLADRRRHSSRRDGLMYGALKTIAEHELSKDVREVVDKGLSDDGHEAQ